MDFFHGFSHILIELDRLERLPLYRFLDLFVKPKLSEHTGDLAKNDIIPRVDMHMSQLKLLDYIPQG